MQRSVAYGKLNALQLICLRSRKKFQVYTDNLIIANWLFLSCCKKKPNHADFVNNEGYIYNTMVESGNHYYVLLGTYGALKDCRLLWSLYNEVVSLVNT